MQTTSHILMIRPVRFGFNAETAVNNAFQANTGDPETQEKALKEFDDLVALLKTNGVDVMVVQDVPEPYTPDSVFPNNWISFHNNGSVILYPMYAPNRRSERKEHVMQAIAERFTMKTKIDLSKYENGDLFLEGTGSLVLDRDHKIAYACLSPRTHEKVIADFCWQTGYKAIVFNATDSRGMPVYHTNVMMCVADKYVVICLDAIEDKIQKEKVRITIIDTGKQIIPISRDQMNCFAGNMLQVESKTHEKLLIMSTRAFESLSEQQIDTLTSYNRIIHSSLSTIETNGGGSARCMMAEIHLPALQ